MDDFEKRWKRIQDMLGVEARGDRPPVVCSQRTLFGIPSRVEQVMDAIAREDEEKHRAQREAARQAERAERAQREAACREAARQAARVGQGEADGDASDPADRTARAERAADRNADRNDAADVR